MDLVTTLVVRPRGSSTPPQSRIKVLYASSYVHPGFIRRFEYDEVRTEQAELMRAFAAFDVLHRKIKHVDAYGNNHWKSHSVIIRGQPKATALTASLAEYPGIDFGQDEIELAEPFRPLVHRWEALENYRDTTDDADGRADELLLIEALEPAVRNSLHFVAQLKKTDLVSWASLDFVFAPGEIILAEQDGGYVDWSGSQFGYATKSIDFVEFSGSKPLASLPLYPMTWAKNLVTWTRDPQSPDELSSMAMPITIASALYGAVGSARVNEREDGLRRLGKQFDTAHASLEHKQTAKVDVDFVEGKGRDPILLMFGPPGAGKTLTAEAVAEECHAPLYSMSASDLGSSPSEVEKSLDSAFESCALWGALLPLDEADVFVAARSVEGLERNELVSIFLRHLEHYQGVLFLTTNRIQTIDPAFQSRIDLIIPFEFLTPDKFDLSEDDIEKLANMNLNGR
ncbi:putative Ubiquitin-like protease family profile domain-containing protein [Seiridium cardinale]